MAEVLRDELLSVPGIAGAEVDTDQGVAGVRVQLAVGADPEEVGAAVRQILTDHGMRPADQPLEDQVPGPPPPPGAPSSVVSFPLVGEHARSQSPATDATAEAKLESVAIEETPDGVAVLVRSSDGTRAGSTLGSMADLDVGAAAAVAELVGVPDVKLADVLEEAVGDLLVLTVLIDVGGEIPRVGAALQSGGRAYAIARAVWAALTSRV